MYSYLVEGGHPLKGRIRPSGNKNAALPCLAATLLSDEEVILKNVPDIDATILIFDVQPQRYWSSFYYRSLRTFFSSCFNSVISSSFAAHAGLLARRS